MTSKTCSSSVRRHRRRRTIIHSPRACADGLAPVCARAVDDSADTTVLYCNKAVTRHLGWLPEVCDFQPRVHSVSCIPYPARAAVLLRAGADRAAPIPAPAASDGPRRDDQHVRLHPRRAARRAGRAPLQGGAQARRRRARRRHAHAAGTPPSPRMHAAGCSTRTAPGGGARLSATSTLRHAPVRPSHPLRAIATLRARAAGAPLADDEARCA